MNVLSVGQSTPLPAASVAPGPNLLPTPINVDALSHLLKLSNYDHLLSDELVHGFRCGFRVPFDGVLPSSPVHNHSSVLNDVSTVDDMLSHEISLGRIAGPFSEVPLPDFVLSHLRLVPKKDSLSFRLFHNLSFPWGNSVNSGIPRQFCTVAYEDYDYFVSLVANAGSGCFLAKADIEAAFRIIPISPRDYHLLGFSFNNMYYYDRCLPMGCSVSCQVFEKLSCGLQWILQKRFLVLTMSHILDDFIFISPSSLECNMFLNSFFQLANSLGIPVKHAKTVYASTCVTVHGIEIDTLPMQARLPDSKLFAARDRVHSFSRRKKVTLLELQSLIGTLNFACKVVTPGRPFLQRLIDLTIGIVRPHWHIRLTNEARLDLAAWALFLDHFNGTSILLDSIQFPTEHLELFTDASGIGFGAVMQSNWFQGSWPQSWHGVNIAVNLFPLIPACTARPGLPLSPPETAFLESPYYRPQTASIGDRHHPTNFHSVTYTQNDDAAFEAGSDNDHKSFLRMRVIFKVEYPAELFRFRRVLDDILSSFDVF